MSIRKIKKLSPDVQLKLCNCTVAYTFTVLTPPILDEKNHYRADVLIVEKRQKPKKGEGPSWISNLFSARGSNWPAVPPPSQTRITLVFVPEKRKIQLLGVSNHV